MDKIGLIDEIVPRYRSPYFRHIFAGGYSAGYYSYVWAEVLDADAFEAFKETGDIFDPATAQSFRENILARGGSEDPWNCTSSSGARIPRSRPCWPGRDWTDHEPEPERRFLPVRSNSERRGARHHATPCAASSTTTSCPGCASISGPAPSPWRSSPNSGAMGLLGSSITGPGCPGLSGTIYGLICRELERGDSGLRSFASVQGSLVMWPIATYGSDEQKRTLAARAGGRPQDRLLRPDRTRPRLRPRRHEDPRRPRRRRLDPQRQPSCGSPTPTWPTWPWSGPAARRRRPRLPGRAGHARLLHQRHPRQVQPAGQRHRRTGPRRGAGARQRTACPAPRA